MTDINLAEALSKVAAEAGVRIQTNDDEHNQLIDDYNSIFDELEKTDLLLKSARSNNVDLIHELNDAKAEAWQA